MAKRGRPKGSQPGPFLMMRGTLAMWGYEEARRKGEKHETALQEGVKRVQNYAPEMPISETEVRRVVREFRPAGSPNGLTVGEPPEGHRTFKQPDGREFPVLCTVYSGLRIEYPRANKAKE